MRSRFSAHSSQISIVGSDGATYANGDGGIPAGLAGRNTIVIDALLSGISHLHRSQM
jgi:hypothetical protein